MIKRLDHKRIAAIDRRLAAIHEAGHVVIARGLGLVVLQAWIEPSGRTQHQLKNEKSWTGRTTIQRSVDPLERRMVGTSGSVAELCWWGGDIDPDYWTNPDMMSLSDWRLSGCEPGQPDQMCCEAIERMADCSSGAVPAGKICLQSPAAWSWTPTTAGGMRQCDGRIPI